MVLRHPTRNELWLGLVLLLVAFGAIQRCGRNAPKTLPDNALAPNEAEKIAVDTNQRTITVTKREGKKGTVIQKVLADGSRKATIIINKDGTVTVNAQTHGFIFEPGGTIFVSDKLRAGIDIQLGYWRRWGFNAGVGYGGNNVDAYGAIGYTLPFALLDNTSVFVGRSFRSKLVVGLRIKF